MKRTSLEPYSSLCVTTASALAALVAAVAATAIATAAAVAVISGSGAGSSLGTAIFIAAVLAAAASGLLAACIANPPATTPAPISEDSSGRQIVIPLTTVQDGLKALVQITKGRQLRPSRRRPTKKRHLPDEPLPTPLLLPQASSSPSLAFHERCGRILQTCDLLVRHFPATRTLCILRTAEGILARRPHRLVEPEPTWESDIDVDLDPVLSAPDLDEALRRLDQRIRSAKKYKERNERLQSTSLVLEAEKRRAIRSSAEQYLVHEDPLTPDISSEPIQPTPIDHDDSLNVCAAFYPKPKARSSLFHLSYPTEPSHHLPLPEIIESPSEDPSNTVPHSYETEITGFTSSQNDFKSSVVEMNSEVTPVSQSTTDAFVQNTSEVFSSSSLEKETENEALSPHLIQNTGHLLAHAEAPIETEDVPSTSTATSTASEYSLSNLIEKKQVPSDLPEKEVSSSTETQGRDKALLLPTCSMTAIAEETPPPDMQIAEITDDDDDLENWSSIVEAVACGLIETEVVSLPASVDPKDLTPSLIGVEDIPMPLGCEETGTSSLHEAILSPPPSIPGEDLTPPLTESEADLISNVRNNTDALSPNETVPSPSALMETEDLTPSLIRGEYVSIAFGCEKSGTSQQDETVKSFPTSTPAEDLTLPLTKNDAVSLSSISNNTEPSLLEGTVTSIQTEESSLPFSRSETDSTISICEKICAPSAKIASSPYGAEIPNNTIHLSENLREKTAVSASNKIENLDEPDKINVYVPHTPRDFVTGSKTPLHDNLSAQNDIATTNEEATSTETHSLSDIESKIEDSVDSDLKMVKHDGASLEQSYFTCATGTLSSATSYITLDLNVDPSKMEHNFEQLLENISPPPDIEESFTAVSLDISALNETISDETKETDTCVTAQVNDANEDRRFSSHVVVAAMERINLEENYSEILISGVESKLCLPDPETHQKELDSIGENAYLRESSPSNARLDTCNEERRVQNTQDIPRMANIDEEPAIEPAKPTLHIEKNEAVANLERTHSFNETESKFDREIQSYGFNLGTEVMSDGASDCSSMSVSPNPDISFLRTSETNPTAESCEDAIKVDFPEEKKGCVLQTSKTMDNFGFGEPLMVVTARKVTTYVDDTVRPTQPKDKFAQKRRVRISTDDFEFDVPRVHERKVCLVRSSVKRSGAKTPDRFEPICRHLTPPETYIRKPLKPEALRPFSGKEPNLVEDERSPCSDALPGQFFRSLERRDDARQATLDHSSSFPLSMRVPHRRAFWDYKLKEPKSESPKRQPSIKVTGIVKKCKETFQTLSSTPEDSSPITIQENDLPGNHQRRFQEARFFFQNLEGKREPKSIPAEPTSKPDSTATVKPRKRMQPATVAERFNITGIYQDVLGDGAAKTAAGSPLRGVPRREAVVATLHSFRK